MKHHNSADYYAIDPRYGTLDDWDRLIKGVHSRGMKLMCVTTSRDGTLLNVSRGFSMDLVVKHTSDEVGRLILISLYLAAYP
jgi:oligo-1,6-glucosidase